MERPAADQHWFLALAIGLSGVLEEDESRLPRYVCLSLDSADFLCKHFILLIGAGERFELFLLLASQGSHAAVAPEVERVEAEDAHGLFVEHSFFNRPSEHVLDWIPSFLCECRGQVATEVCRAVFFELCQNNIV